MSTLEETWGRERLVATLYDFGVHNPVVGRVAALGLWGFDIRRLFASIERLRDAAPGTRVLDVPCGGGLAFGGLHANHGLDYTALDFSPVMLQRAGARMEKLGLDGIRFRQGDVGALPFEDGSMDLCLTYNGVHCFPDPARAVREMGRVLRRGGVLRGSLVVRDAGLRYDMLIALFRQRGWFGPGCSRDQFMGWLGNAGLMVRAVDVSGAFVVFEAVKR